MRNARLVVISYLDQITTELESTSQVISYTSRELSNDSKSGNQLIELFSENIIKSTINHLVQDIGTEQKTSFGVLPLSPEVKAPLQALTTIDRQ
jgi:hypothetical protein